jgi:HAE1 family hydrophobic/amphiphilic exporter-1
VLLSIAIVIAGSVAYFKIPVAALPSFNTPIISVTASLPGAAPENMASRSLAQPIHRLY